jgi:hypothetical protein
MTAHTDRKSADDRGWPALPLARWRDTRDTLHLWTQMVGKTRLALAPHVNHWWQVALYVNAVGLTTSLMPANGGRTTGDGRGLEIVFDFVEHSLELRTSYAEYLARLSELGVEVVLNPMPAEMDGAVPFDTDHEHASYDPAAVHDFWRSLVSAHRVLSRFRGEFTGKASPVHFFWGSFDLAVTRFSGRRAPTFTGKAPGLDPAVMQEAYSHEVSSAGFWPGGNGIDYAAFYSYAYPTPAQFKSFPVQPTGAVFNETLGEYLLPYDTVRTAANPDAALLAFLRSTYEAAAESAKWDRGALECSPGGAGVPRKV